MEKVPVLPRQIREPETPVLTEDTPELERIDRVATSATPSVIRAMLAHPLIERTKLALSEGRTTSRGTLRRPRSLVVEKKAAESTSAIVYGEKIRFGVIERSRQVKLTNGCATPFPG